MGVYKYIKQIWQKPKENLGDIWQQRLIKWRRQPSTVRIDRPTRLDRARALGYKAKQGYIVVRQRVPRGGHTRQKPSGGRRPRNYHRRLNLAIPYQVIAEQRAAKKYPNCEVLNSYYVAKDGKYYWYEIILVDVSHPVIRKDKTISWIAEKQHKGRAFRGLTSAAKKARGLAKKGKGAEKVRPSMRANKRRAK